MGEAELEEYLEVRLVAVGGVGWVGRHGVIGLPSG